MRPGVVGKEVAERLVEGGWRVVAARDSVVNRGEVACWVEGGAEVAMAGEGRVVGWVVVETAVGWGVGWGAVVVPAEVRRVAVWVVQVARVEAWVVSTAVV